MTIIKRLPKDDPIDVINESLKPMYAFSKFKIMTEDNTLYAEIVKGKITFAPDMRCDGWLQ